MLGLIEIKTNIKNIQNQNQRLNLKTISLSKIISKKPISEILYKN